MSNQEKYVQTPEVSINGNIMIWKNTVIQLSNICSVTTVPMRAEAFPIWIIGVIVVAFLFLYISFPRYGGDIGSIFAWLIIAGIIAAGIIIYIVQWDRKNDERVRKRYLVIDMNSGISFHFYFEDQLFLQRVFYVMSSIICEGNKTQNVRINLDNCTISGNAKILNDIMI